MDAVIQMWIEKSGPYDPKKFIEEELERVNKAMQVLEAFSRGELVKWEMPYQK